MAFCPPMLSQTFLFCPKHIMQTHDESIDDESPQTKMRADVEYLLGYFSHKPRLNVEQFSMIINFFNGMWTIA